MENIGLSSIAALTIQCAGIVLIALLFFFMTRSIRRLSLDYWTAAWACLAVSLTALLVGIRAGQFRVFFAMLYFLGEYGFGYLLIAGCRNYTSEYVLARRHLIALLPATLVAVLISTVSNFSVAMIPHSLILAAMFATAFIVLKPVRRRSRSSVGLRVMSFALILLTVGFLHYAAAFAFALVTGQAAAIRYLRYLSVYDLILETLLGFGTVIVVMEDVSREVEEKNRELLAARDRLEAMARLDPLTEALNRHAFYSLVASAKTPPTPGQWGCVVVIDIDNLKPINDSLGHAAGDVAIRAVAKAVRSVIRPDDMLFRWGGDEFLVVLFNVKENEVRKRVQSLNAVLAETSVPGERDPVAVTVSYGFASFEAITELEKAIERADDGMYATKQTRRVIRVLDQNTPTSPK